MLPKAARRTFTEYSGEVNVTPVDTDKRNLILKQCDNLSSLFQSGQRDGRHLPHRQHQPVVHTNVHRSNKVGIFASLVLHTPQLVIRGQEPPGAGAFGLIVKRRVPLTGPDSS